MFSSNPKRSGSKAPANERVDHQDLSFVHATAVPSRETSHSVLHDPFPDYDAARSPKSAKNAKVPPAGAQEDRPHH